MIPFIEFYEDNSNMDKISILDENWHTLVSLFPKHWEALALSTGAMTRKLRHFDSAEAIMRTLLLHIARGYSLRETVVQAKAAGLVSISDVALLKRLRCSEEWLKTLCFFLLKENNFIMPTENRSFNIRLVDGTIIKEQGKTGSQWRIHYSISVPDFRCDYFEITATKGIGVAETLQKLPISSNDCLIADRGFSHATDIHYVSNHNAYVLVRVNTQILPFYQDAEAQKRFDLLQAVQTLKVTGQTQAWEVYVRAPEASEAVRGRLCVIRKSEQAIAMALKKLHRKASKNQHELKERTIEFAHYVIVFTTLPEQSFTTAEVLEWYRIRWQIELVFKRFKSLAKLGHLPKYDPNSSRAWLYGKLFVCLLTEKLIRCASTISPWGYCCS